MPFLKSLPEDSGPPNIFNAHPAIYAHWSEMSQVLMNGPSSLTQGERELVLAFAAGVADCAFVCIAHAEVAYEWGMEDGLVERLLSDFDNVAIEPRLKALLSFVRKLAATASPVTQADADRFLASGWDEKAFHDAIAITARMAFMQKLVAGYGFAPLSRDTARRHARRRVERGYVALYRAFAAKPGT